MGVLAVRLLVGLMLLWSTAALAARPTDASSTEMYHYAATDVVEHFDSTGGRFRIFYTRAGLNAVPLDDLDNDGVPDRVTTLAVLYEAAWDFHAGLGFRTPLSDASNAGDHGGDGRFDVYLIDFGKSSDGAYRRESCDASHHCSGFIAQENDFAGYGYPSLDYADRVLASHELFHAFQSAYDDSETAIFGEGTAVWATEQFDASLNDFEDFIDGYLSKPDRSLNVPEVGGVDFFSYGCAIFFEYLSERFGDAIIRELWEASEGTPDWFSSLDGVLKQHQSSFADAFIGFATWNLYTSKRADPARSYAAGAQYPLVRIDPLALPATVDTQRIYSAATNYLALAPGARASLTVSLANPTHLDLSSLHLAAARRSGNHIDDPAFSTDGRTLTIDATGADQIIVFLINTAQTGDSLRPGLCAGSADEVATCMATLDPMVPVVIPPVTVHHGCAVVSAPEASFAMLFLVGVALLLSRRRYV